MRVSVGFPSRRALSAKRRAIGECWSVSAAMDRKAAIFISPIIDDGVDVLAVLLHEVLHAVYPEAGHQGEFARAAKAAGLVGKMTATTAGPWLTQRLNDVLNDIGPYPHAKLNPLVLERNKQGTRLLKALCPSCSYTVRVTRKWVNRGLPMCSRCTRLFVLV